MNNLLFGISLSALLSVTSFLIVLFRVSPLMAPAQALPAFFVSLFLAVSTTATLAFLGIWKILPIHTWDLGKTTTIALRQGFLLGAAVCVLFVFLLLELLNWWITILIFAVFGLIEVACKH